MRRSRRDHRERTTRSRPDHRHPSPSPNPSPSPSPNPNPNPNPSPNPSPSPSPSPNPNPSRIEIGFGLEAAATICCAIFASCLDTLEASARSSALCGHAPDQKGLHWARSSRMLLSCSRAAVCVEGSATRCMVRCTPSRCATAACAEKPMAARLQPTPRLRARVSALRKGRTW